MAYGGNSDPLVCVDNALEQTCTNIMPLYIKASLGNNKLNTMSLVKGQVRSL